MPERVLLTAEDIRRAIVRIAHEILEAHRGTHDLVLIGMRTRGGPLAKRLAAAIKEFEGEEIPVGVIDFGLYRDDLRTRGTAVQIAPSEMPTDIRGKSVVIVDDVVSTGRSVRAAIEAVIDFGRPQRIQFAVLIDRGHRELPIRPDYVGKNVPTARGDDVRVHLVEADGVDEVTIVRQED